MKGIVRVGVVGCGVMGQHHLRSFQKLPLVEIVGVADIDKEKAEAAALYFQTQAFHDYRALLDIKPDIIDVVVPTSLHRKVALDALQVGAHIIVEKPLADSVESGKAIIKASREVEKALMVGHIERFNPAVAELKEVVQEGRLGKVVSAHSQRAGPFSPRTFDVGVILDLSTHDIDIISYLYGERVRFVHAIAGSELHQHEDHATILLQFNNGKAGVVEVNWLVPYKVRELVLTGLKGVATLNFIQQQVTVLDKRWSQEMKVERGEPLFLELKHFVEVVCEGEKPTVSGVDSLHALAVALKALESIKKRQGQIVDEELWKI